MDPKTRCDSLRGTDRGTTMSRARTDKSGNKVKPIRVSVAITNRLMQKTSAIVPPRLHHPFRTAWESQKQTLRAYMVVISPVQPATGVYTIHRIAWVSVSFRSSFFSFVPGHVGCGGAVKELSEDRKVKSR